MTDAEFVEAIKTQAQESGRVLSYIMGELNETKRKLLEAEERLRRWKEMLRETRVMDLGLPIHVGALNSFSANHIYFGQLWSMPESDIRRLEAVGPKGAKQIVQVLEQLGFR